MNIHLKEVRLYNFIINPVTHRKVSIYGKKGQKILQQYYSLLYGGATKTTNIAINDSEQDEKTTLQLPKIGLGTWFDIYQKSAEEITQLKEEMVNAVENALLHGYTMIDTANSYPAEREIGAKIREMVSNGIVAREDITIIAKGGSGTYQMELSLENYGGYVDIYLWHFPTSLGSFNNIYTQWKNIVEYAESTGNIGQIGLSNIYPPLLNRLVDTCKIDNVTIPEFLQVEIHHLNPEYDLVNYCQQENIIPIAYSPLGQGLFIQDVEIFQSMASKYSSEETCSVYQISLAWNIKRGIIVIPKSVSPERQVDNLRAVEIANIMSEEDLQIISENITSNMALTHSALDSKEQSLSIQ